MKRVHLLRVETDPDPFRPLFEAAREAGLRLGWLEWWPEAMTSGRSEPRGPEPAKTVRVEGRRVASSKRLRGPAVLADVLREHFRGCFAVLVRGELARRELPGASRAWALEPEEGGYLIRGLDDVGRSSAFRLDAEALIRRLRRPRPFEGSGSPSPVAGKGSEG